MKLTHQVEEIIKEDRFWQISETVFGNTKILLKKEINTYDLRSINANEGKINLLNISIC